jgi:5-methylcytosine-specific restriction endonuclease McrA
MKEYEEVRALLSQRLSDTSFENVFEVLMTEFLERNDPARKKARRDASKLRRKAEPTRKKTRSRHIPAAVQNEVFIRDKGCCTYVGNTGKRCGSTQALQIDHIEPFSRGGTNAASNLRLLCAKHNRLAAEDLFGPGYVKRFQPRE